jgi:hypothetical protein
MNVFMGKQFDDVTANPRPGFGKSSGSAKSAGDFQRFLRKKPPKGWALIPSSIVRMIPPG